MSDRLLTPEELRALRFQKNEERLLGFRKWCQRYGIPIARQTVQQMVDMEPVSIRGGLVPSQEGEDE